MKRFVALVLAVLVAACGSSDPAFGTGGGSAPPPPPGPSDSGLRLPATADRQRAECVIGSPMRAVGVELDLPGRIETDTPPVGAATGDCAGNTQFRFGSGIADITGPVANTSGMGWEQPTQVLSGLQQRQHSRAFALESPCNGQRVIFVSTDTAMVFGTVRQGVLAAIAADPALSAHYGPTNVMLSATHTHQGPAGFSHYEAYNLFHFGFDQLLLDTIVNGMVESIRMAHLNLEAHPETAAIRLGVGELLNTNINRSLPAFVLNTEAERNEFLDAAGRPIETDKRFVQLSLVRPDGTGVGVINWFGVHPTMIGSNLKLASSDMKGYASVGFERIMRSDYDAPAGADRFVAAFAQTDEGDSSPNLYIRERPFPDPTRGGGADEYESMAISGTKQLARSLELYDRGSELRGPIDVRFMHVKMDEVAVTDEAVLASLRHPPELDAAEKRTCLGALGPSFGAGAEDGPGPTVEGASCANPDLAAQAARDVMAALGAKIPPELASTAVLCNVDQLPLLDLSCHAEKPILFIVGPPLSAEPSILPFQLFRIGNLAIVGLPWEVTTMSARRIRKTLLETLAPAGIDTVVIAGLANDFVHYLPTREEYSSQQYEGASSIFGPWTSAAVQQETRRLALAMRDATPVDPGPAYVDAMPRLVRTPYIPSDLPGAAASYGEIVTDVPATASPGDIVTAEFQSAHPRNDLRIGQSYGYAERQVADGTWEVVAQDHDPELRFVWKPLYPSPLPVELPQVGPSTADIVWHIPRNTPAGVYRLRHDGASQTLLLPLAAFSGVSSPFVVGLPTSVCPDH